MTSQGSSVPPPRSPRAALPVLAAALLALLGLLALLVLPGLPVPLRRPPQAAALAAPAGSADGTATLTVGGSGSVQATPDWARLQLGVRVRAASAQAASQAAGAAMEKVLQALRQAGVDSRQIQTSDYSLAPVYGPEGTAAAPSAYEAVHMLSVGVPADRAGAVLDAAAQAGANQSGGVVFDLRDRSALERQAVQLAIDDARERAQAAAAHAGLRLLGLRSLQVGDAGSPIPFAVRSLPAAEAAVPLQPGQLTVTATVQAVFDAAPAGG